MVSSLSVQVTQLFSGATQLSDIDLDALTHRLVLLRASRRGGHLNERETLLLETINRSLSEQQQQRLEALNVKRKSGKLSGKSHQELLFLVEQAEQLDAERFEALAELAALRSVPVTTLMQQLQLRTAEIDG